MKHFTIAVLAVVLMVCSCFFVASAEEEPDPIVVEYGNITVIFDGNTTLDEAQRLAVVQMIVGEYCGGVNHQHIHGDDPNNIICNIFGHNKITETLVVIEHCVRDEPPRCLENIGTLTTCSRCDYNDFEVEFSSYIFCH